jgi:hypothetical protein
VVKRKVYLIPVEQLSLDVLKRIYDDSRADARKKAASDVEGENKDVSKTT